VKDALRVERDYLRPLPHPLPDVASHTEARVMKDGFVRVGGVDYSVPPGLSGRRVGVHLSLVDVRITLEGELLACHRRSYVPADVVLDPSHARALRLHRQAKGRLASSDVSLAVPDLSLYDRAIGLG